MEEKAQLSSQAEVLKETLEANRADTDALREEMETMLTVSHKWWDTSRINGTPQRFLTEYVLFIYFSPCLTVSFHRRATLKLLFLVICLC